MINMIIMQLFYGVSVKINEFKLTLPNLSGILAILYLIDYKYNKIKINLLKLNFFNKVSKITIKYFKVTFFLD